MAGRIVGMISVLTLAGVIASAVVLLLLALDSEGDTGRKSAEVFAEAIARSLLEADLASLSEDEVNALIRLNAASAADVEGEAVDLDNIWVFNVQARLAASSDGSRPISRTEVASARQAMEGGDGASSRR